MDCPISWSRGYPNCRSISWLASVITPAGSTTSIPSGTESATTRASPSAVVSSPTALVYLKAIRMAVGDCHGNMSDKIAHFSPVSC